MGGGEVGLQGGILDEWLQLYFQRVTPDGAPISAERPSGSGEMGGSSSWVDLR